MATAKLSLSRPAWPAIGVGPYGVRTFLLSSLLASQIPAQLTYQRCPNASLIAQAEPTVKVMPDEESIA